MASSSFIPAGVSIIFEVFVASTKDLAKSNSDGTRFSERPKWRQKGTTPRCHERQSIRKQLPCFPDEAGYDFNSAQVRPVWRNW